MRGTQSVLVLAQSGKDKDNYSLNRQSPRLHPHNHASVCILGSFHVATGQTPQNEAMKQNNCPGWIMPWPRVSGEVWEWTLKGHILKSNHISGHNKPKIREGKKEKIKR